MWEAKIVTGHIFEKPFALFMGPQRAGTSWLDAYFRYRGDVCLPSEVKEIFFFDRHHSRGLDFYTSHFDIKPGHALIAEVSTTAFDHSDAPRRVKEIFGDDLTLICPLRMPVPRSYSLYTHYRRYGLVSGSLMEACEQEPQILNSSRYVRHLERWFEFFAPGQIHFIFQEDLEQDQERFVHNLCDLLDLTYQEVPRELTSRINVSTESQNGMLASLAQKSGDFLRERRLYWLVNAAKGLGLKDMIFGREKPENGAGGMSMLEKQWLDERLGSEVERLEALIGPIPQWHESQDKENAPRTAEMV